MRIIGGKYKRRNIHPPSNITVRPTTDLAKESLFNILNNHFNFEAITVLDLFAGTGNISLEFASRGAINVYSVDTDPICAKFLRSQAEKFLIDSIKVVRDDVHHFLSICKINFDIIFADPPYDHKKIDNVHKMVFENALLKEGGWLIIEHGAETKLDDFHGFFEKRKYGRVHFSMFAYP